jgi:hypothetical protein
MSFIGSLRVRCEEKPSKVFAVLVDGREVFSGTKQEAEKRALAESLRIEGL